MFLLTLKDLIDDLSVFTGKAVDGDKVSAVRSAALAAIREMATIHQWNYYRTRYRFNTVPSQTGAFTFVASTGVATITDGTTTWPAWSPDGRLFAGQFEYRVQAVLTSTTARLDPATRPAADIATATGYQLNLDLYPLPTDFATVERASVANGGGRMSFRNFGTLMQVPLQMGTPGEFSIEAARTPPGRLAMRVYPAPTDVQPIEVMYRRRPAEPRLAALDPGPVRVAGDGLSLTADKGVFTARHLGCVVRLSFDGKPPTGAGGVNPAADERVVTAVTDTTLTWEGAVAVPTGKVGCVVSDLVDLEPATMGTALTHIARRHLRHLTRAKTVGDEVSMEKLSIAAARDADARYAGPRTVGEYGYGRRLATAPIVEDRP